MLDLGPTFRKEADHLGSLVEDRDVVNAGRVPFPVPYFNDCLGGIYPKDLILIGAATGVGKTELAVDIAMGGVDSGKQTYGFFLEAEKGEVAARLYFKELARLANNPRLDYGGWWRGQYKHLDRQYGDQVQAALKPKLECLHTLYKERGDFTPGDLSKQLEAILGKAELVVLDHVHVIDADSSQSERYAERKTVRVLRDMALDAGIPVVAVSHLRKKQAGQAGTLVPEMDELHGASDLSKVATQLIMVARDWDGPKPQPHLSPTLMRIPKDRKARGSTYVARVYYDLSKGRYEQAYELGRLDWENRKQCWRLLEEDRLPHWAVREARRVAGSTLDI